MVNLWSLHRPLLHDSVVEMAEPEVAEKTMEMFRDSGAYLQGHFRLTSGLHSPEYLQCARVLSNPEYADRLGKWLALALNRLDSRWLELVVSPAMGGIIIGHEVASAMGTPFFFTERGGDGKMTLRRGFQLNPPQTAFVVEDVITTGGSSREVVELLTAAGVDVFGVGSIIDRSGGTADLGVPHVSLVTLKTETYSEADCPLCKQGIPMDKPGSRPV
jgi:orotate phosphoribosyltransferase